MDIFLCNYNLFVHYLSKNHVNFYRTSMANVNWKDKRVAAINRLSDSKGWTCSENNPLFEQYTMIMDPKIKTKKQLKEELKKNGHQ